MRRLPHQGGRRHASAPNLLQTRRAERDDKRLNPGRMYMTETELQTCGRGFTESIFSPLFPRSHHPRRFSLESDSQSLCPLENWIIQLLAVRASFRRMNRGREKPHRLPACPFGVKTDDCGHRLESQQSSPDMPDIDIAETLRRMTVHEKMRVSGKGVKSFPNKNSDLEKTPVQ